MGFQTYHQVAPVELTLFFSATVVPKFSTASDCTLLVFQSNKGLDQCKEFLHSSPGGHRSMSNQKTTNFNLYLSQVLQRQQCNS